MTINLAEDLESNIYWAISCTNSLLANVILNDNGSTSPDYSDKSTTKNGCITYPIYHIPCYMSVVAPALTTVDSSLKKMINRLTLFLFVFTAQGSNVRTSPKHQYSLLQCLCSTPTCCQRTISGPSHVTLLVQLKCQGGKAYQMWYCGSGPHHH
jgi:hypothetical protein